MTAATPPSPAGRRVYITLIIGLLCIGCPEGKALDAGPPEAGVQVVDAGPPVAPGDLPPIELNVGLELWFADGGVQEIPPSTPALIDPLQRLTLSLPELKDYRVRVFDGADKIVASDDRAQAADGGILYEISLAEPLKRGREYRVAIDAESGGAVADPTGRRYLDAEFLLKVDGPAEPEPKPGKKSGGKPRKRSK
jgi:hypothetical protein